MEWEEERHEERWEEMGKRVAKKFLSLSCFRVSVLILSVLNRQNLYMSSKLC